MKMRVAIRDQLAVLGLLAVLVGLMIVSIPTWVYVHRFIVNITLNELSLTASLKASRISAELDLVQTICNSISSRILIQESLYSFYAGKTTDSNWNLAETDMQTALSVGGYTTLLQARLYSRNSTGNPYGLLNVTGVNIPQIVLPYKDANGSAITLGNSSEGYPSELYPNITYEDLLKPSTYDPNTSAYSANAFNGVTLTTNGGLLLGPLVINETFSLISMTIPVRDLTEQPGFVLGYMTVVAMASSLINLQSDREGLGNSGIVMLVGPASQANRFNDSDPASNATYKPDKNTFGNVLVHYLLPPIPAPGQPDRHSQSQFQNGTDEPFPLKDYPAILSSFADQFKTSNNASADLATTNEQDVPVSVGFARTNTQLVNWTVVIEMAQSEAYEPIDKLRNILLGCVFGTAGLILVIIFPCAHISVKPIRMLKAATEKSIHPPGYDMYDEDFGDETPGAESHSEKSRRGVWEGLLAFLKLTGRKKQASEGDRESARRIFKIPGKVPIKRHFITDELTELTQTFNDMSDELVKQYTSLEERVSERTRELEISKKAAEAANESKTLFIANISHELKTPLNGILGMCSVCMEENDLVRIKQSLKTLYKSGDLLLHLLEDLLSFSKNEIGQQLNLEVKEFRLADIRSQILTIFDKQVKEGRINFSVVFLSTEDVDVENTAERKSMEKRLPALAPQGSRLKDMCLWGDTHRILQVLINLVSNSLKFTPPGGKVEVKIRCLGEVEERSVNDDSRSSSFSKSSGRGGRTRHRVGSGSTHSTGSRGGTSNTSQFKGGTPLAVNPMDPKTNPQIRILDRSPTPPPPNARTFRFEFEVVDTGPGIPEHMQQRVFEPFVQGDLGLSKKYGGTGLGLSICQQLASLMGGTITLKSMMGVGSTFTMHIPLKYVKDRASSTASSSIHSRPGSVDATEQESHRNSITSASDPSTASVLNKQPRLLGLSQPFFAANPETQSTENKMAVIDQAIASKDELPIRVLVADDNSTNIEVVSKMLKLEAISDVTVAKDGQEAYDVVKANMKNNQGFDIIFMDIQMPNLNGLESTRLIRETGYKAPIVALTAFSEESNVRECMESGMDEFLSKPIRRPALKQVLKKFATIPEEPETASLLTRKTTPGDGTAKVPSDKERDEANGAPPRSRRLCQESSPTA